MAPKSTSVSKIQIKLMNVGKKLLLVPSSSPNLLNLLAQVEQVLSEVQRSPSESIEHAMYPIVDALIAKKLLRHRDMEVNISVSCCICEILRIMAPDLPYTNEQMKEFLELVVMTFEKLSSAFGGCYTRMTKFLTICSNFRMPVLMSDLQLDGLVVRLCKQFLTFADSNSSAVVSQMEEFMTMMIEESEPLNLELVDLLVTSVRKEKQVILPKLALHSSIIICYTKMLSLLQIASPVCWQLGGKVIKNCAAQLKPHLPHMVKETSPHTAEQSKLGRVTTHKIKLECLEGTSNLLGIYPEKKTVSFDDPQIADESLTKLSGKRKRNLSPQKKQAQSVMRGENLVGSRVKVYWPQDKMYYQGVVESFDCIQKRHKILYDDGDEEILDLKREQWELVENVSAMSNSDKVSSSQSGIMCVQGYKVKRSVAPILKAIFRKHGDIAAKCFFQAASVRASLLTVVCDIVRRIQANNVIEMKEIESEISDAEQANINVLWLRAHLEATYKRKEAMKDSTLLMEMKANTILVKRAAKMDLEERRIELVVAQQQFKKAERCVEVLDLVQKKLNDNLQEVKAAQQPIL